MTFSISIFLGLGSQKFLGILWDLVEFLGLGLGLGLNSENFGIGIGIEFENFWDWDWDSFFLKLGLELGFFCRPLGETLLVYKIKSFEELLFRFK